MKEKKDIEALARKFIDNTATEQEIAQLMTLLRSQPSHPDLEAVIDEMILKIDADESLEKRADTAQHHVKIDAILSKQRPARAKQVFWSARRIAAAITMLMVAVLAIYFLNTLSETGMLVHQTVAGKKSRITLPDGSTVELNSESKLTYPEKFDAGIREVLLEGEAFFIVKANKDKPFIVTSKHLVTKVLGTSFNVRAFSDEKEVQVVVASGKVSVKDRPMRSTATKEVVLTRNEMVTLDISEKTMTKASGDIDKLIAWKDGTLIFDTIELRQVVKKLERWFGVKIHLDNEPLGNCLVKGKFRGKSLDSILDMIGWSMDNFSYEYTGEGVLVKGKGCETTAIVK
ncbi:MAG: FecR domain-containing protein [Cytophagales bacterium]|nr:FecR domain-containing protein [Cytophagales bacterium]